MLRDVVVHIQNEQPIVADLLNDPVPSDVALICRNLRTTNGKKPVFVDFADSTFVIPLAHVRFIEIHRSSIESAAAEDEDEGAAFVHAPLAPLSWLTGGQIEGNAAPAPELGFAASTSSGIEPHPEEIDPELLRRIREA
jgi:hypothetical protein